MNTNIVEKLLRKAPPVRTPAGLLQDLQSNITLPRGESRITNHESLNFASWFRRWVPALGFALWFLGCIVVFGIQASRIAELKERNQALQLASAAAAERLANAEGLNGTVAELDRLKKDLSDVQRLRIEIEQLRAETQELTALRAHNEQLREELKTRAAPPPKPEEDFFSIAGNRIARIKCVNSLKQICLGALLWADKNKSDALPISRTQFEPFLKEDLLHCPADNATSYDYLSFGARLRDPDAGDVVFVRCPIHNNAGLVDGSVQQLGGKRKAVQRDGKWVIGE